MSIMATDAIMGTAADVDGTSMSLSRRFLSLPQELTGSSLPPKVYGRRCGSVTLCVAHILESAVSSCALPRECLVRVRWWGEEQPGSLFRPILLSGNGYIQADKTRGAPHRAITMNYPVHVGPDQLLEYFQDMEELRMDVIDRDTRRRFGECKLTLDLHKDNVVMTAEEKLVALHRENELCEIRPSDKQEGSENVEVLGYLAVSFEVQWEDSEIQTWRGAPVNETLSLETPDEQFIVSSFSSSATSPTKRQWKYVDGDDFEGSSDKQVPGAKRAVSVASKVSLGSKSKHNVETVASREASADFQRIRRLLEKGKALQKSMEIAVTEKENIDTQVVEVAEVDKAPGFTEVAEIMSRKQIEELSSGLFTEVGKVESGSEDVEFQSWSSSSTDGRNQRQQQQDRETQTGPLRREENSKVLHEKVLKDDETNLRGSEVFQLAVMFDAVSIPAKAVDHVRSSQLPHIALHYWVPSQFTTVTKVSHTVDKFERIARHKLKGSRWMEHAPLFQADFRGHVHVFHSSFAKDASNYFSNGYLIIEVWVHGSQDADRTLLGLSKLPLRKFGQFLRNEGSNLRGFSEQTLPFIGVDGRFPVENPFTGHPAGFLRARVCMGTAEQILALATTIHPIIKLQGVVRGVLYRKRFLLDHIDGACRVCGFKTELAILEKPDLEDGDKQEQEILKVSGDSSQNEIEAEAPALPSDTTAVKMHEENDILGPSNVAGAQHQHAIDVLRPHGVESADMATQVDGVEYVDMATQMDDIENVDMATQMEGVESADMATQMEGVEYVDTATQMDDIENDVATQVDGVEYADVATQMEGVEYTDVATQVDDIEYADMTTQVDRVEYADMATQVDNIEHAAIATQVDDIEYANMATQVNGVEYVDMATQVDDIAMGRLDVVDAQHQIGIDVLGPNGVECADMATEVDKAVEVELFESGVEVTVATPNTHGDIDKRSCACPEKKTVFDFVVNSKPLPHALRMSARSAGGTGRYSNTANIARLSSSDTWKLTKHTNDKVAAEDAHSSAHSLFARDSETERIARIMQGSMRYWMKDDSSSSSSCDGEVSGEEETDGDCYF